MREDIKQADVSYQCILTFLYIFRVCRVHIFYLDVLLIKKVVVSKNIG